MFNEYEIQYTSEENGEFGVLNQVIFTSNEKQGAIDFWDSGWLGVDFFDIKNDNFLLNKFLEPNQIEEQEEALSSLKNLLQEV